MKKFYLSCFTIIFFLQISSAQNAEVSGSVKESDNNEPVSGSSVKYEKG